MLNDTMDPLDALARSAQQLAALTGKRRKFRLVQFIANDFDACPESIEADDSRWDLKKLAPCAESDTADNYTPVNFEIF
jgi:hypothetical protein